MFLIIVRRDSPLRAGLEAGRLSQVAVVSRGLQCSRHEESERKLAEVLAALPTHLQGSPGEPSKGSTQNPAPSKLPKGNGLRPLMSVTVRFE